MACVDRRTVLAAIAVGTIAVVTGGPAALASPVMPRAKVAAPVGVLTRLPGDGNQLALTVDDGASSPVVAAFAQFCRDTGTRLTFFVNGDNRSWTDNVGTLRPMVDSGQISFIATQFLKAPSRYRYGALFKTGLIITALRNTNGWPVV